MNDNKCPSCGLWINDEIQHAKHCAMDTPLDRAKTQLAAVTESNSVLLAQVARWRQEANHAQAQRNARTAERDDVLLKDRGKTNEINVLVAENRKYRKALSDLMPFVLENHIAECAMLRFRLAVRQAQKLLAPSEPGKRTCWECVRNSGCPHLTEGLRRFPDNCPDFEPNEEVRHG